MSILRRMAGLEPILTTSMSGSILTLSTMSSTINSEDAVRLKEEFSGILGGLSPSVRAIALDFSEVLAMSSRGFESLLFLHHGCIEKSVPLSISKITPTFQRLLARMGFLRLLKVDEN